MVEHEGFGNTSSSHALGTVAKGLEKDLEKQIRGMFETNQTTRLPKDRLEKSPGVQIKLAVTRTPVKDRRLTLV